MPIGIAPLSYIIGNAAVIMTVNSLVKKVFIICSILSVLFILLT